MNEAFPNPRALPLLGLCVNLDGEVFPRTRRHTVRLAVAYMSRGRGTQLRTQRPEVLLMRLKDVRSDRQLEWHLSQRVSLKDLVSLYCHCLMFLRLIAKTNVDSPAYQRARRLLGKRPTRLRYLRSALKYCMAPWA